MRISLLPILLLVAFATPLDAGAQVSVNPGELDALAPANPHPAPAQPAPKPKPAIGSAAPAPQKSVAPGAPNVAASAPPGVRLPPPIIVPMRQPSPVQPATITADSPTQAQKLKGGVRLVFGTGRSDLSPEAETALKALVHGDAGHPTPSDGSSFTVTCYAAGTPEDPSTPRRLSLSRALAVRSVLLAQGVPSIRVYVRSFGPASPGFADGPADRADIIVAPNPIATSQSAPPKS